MTETNEPQDPNAIGAFPIEHLDTPEEKKSNLIHSIITLSIVAVVLFVFVGFLLPSTVHVERKIVIDAPPANIYAVLNGFTRFDEWSPWKEMDPEAKTTLSGPYWGKGAKMAWSGPKSGTGTQEVVESKPYEFIKIALTFDEKDQASGTYTLKQAPRGVEVTWGFDMDFGMNLIGRYMGMTMDQSLGKDLDRGLEKLKTLAKAQSQSDLSLVELAVVDAPAQNIAYVAGTTTTDGEAIKAAFTAAYGQIGAFMQASRLEMAGPPLSIADVWDEDGNRYVFKAAIPFKGVTAQGAGGVKVMGTYAGPAVRAIHVGPYAGLKTTYETMEAFMAVTGLKPAGSPWEEYVSDPGTTAEDHLITHVYFPVAVAKK